MQDRTYEAAMKPVRKLLKNAAVKATEVRLVGIAGDELSGYSKKKLDVLAMGSHGYGAFKGAVLGSVATRMVAKGEIPLLFKTERGPLGCIGLPAGEVVTTN